MEIKCPKCGKEERHVFTKDDEEEIKLIGVSRIGFIHGDHTLVINFDSTGFIRGAYIVPSDKAPRDIRIYYDDYKVLSHPRPKPSGYEVIIINQAAKIIDIRLSQIQLSELSFIINYLKDYGKLIHGVIRNVGIAGRRFKVLSQDNLVVIFNGISAETAKFLISYLEDYNFYSLYFALKYLKSKEEEINLEGDALKKQIEFLVMAHKYHIKPRKGINAIRYARASILALWPELSGSFDAILNLLREKGSEGITLLNILPKVKTEELGSLYNMLRELKKRDLIEITDV